MANKSTGLSKDYANLTIKVIEQRNRWKFVKPEKYDTWIKARIPIIVVWDHSDWDLEVLEVLWLVGVNTSWASEGSGILEDS